MSYKETYVEQAIRTAPPVDYLVTMPDINRNMRLLLGAIGIAGESIEVLEAAFPYFDGDDLDTNALVKECGDVTWYAALISDLENVTFDLLLMDDHDAFGLADLAVTRYGINRREAMRECIGIMLVKAKNVSEFVKKQVYHLHAENRLALVDNLRELVQSVQVVAAVAGVGIEVVLRRNIEKFWKRYPERFDPAHSINRKGDDV